MLHNSLPLCFDMDNKLKGALKLTGNNYSAGITSHQSVLMFGVCAYLSFIVYFLEINNVARDLNCNFNCVEIS